MFNINHHVGCPPQHRTCNHMQRKVISLWVGVEAGQRHFSGTFTHRTIDHLKHRAAFAASKQRYPQRDEGLEDARSPRRSFRKMSSSNDKKFSGGDEVAGVLAIIGAIPLVGGAMWAAQGTWYGGFAPYGMVTEETVPRGGYRNNPFHGSSEVPAETTYGTVHFHINPFGWAVLVGFVMFLVAALALAGCAVSWHWWRESGGTKPIPKIPVSAAAYVAGFAAFMLVMLLIGRRESAAGHFVVGVLALGVAASAGWATWTYGTVSATRYRVVRAFEGLAAGVLGNTGNPIAGVVKAFDWKRDAARDADATGWPGTLTAAVGPGWANTPTEHAGLNRAARRMGWPSYQWSYDPMRKRVAGTVIPVGGLGPSIAKNVER